MSDSSGRQPAFIGLVFNQEGELAEAALVGAESFYVILDGDFRRHVEAEVIDRQVLTWLRDQILSNQELVTEGMMRLIGEEDLFTKAAIDASIQDIDTQMERLRTHGLPEGVRAWLGMLGFRIVVDVHGQVVDFEAPEVTDDEGW